MNRIYKKNEVTFAIIMIVIYVIGTSLVESISESLGTGKLIPAIFHVIFTGAILIWVKKNGLEEKYGLSIPKYNPVRAWFFIPLIVVACFGLLAGVEAQYSAVESIFFVISMMCVGFLEEIIFRGFLFVGMASKNIKSAIIVSSITFGIGHIVNLFNGKNLFETLMQIVFAIAVGFVLVILFYRGKSLLPCIVFHGINNSLSAFEKTNTEVAGMISMSEEQFELVYICVLVAILVLYGIVLYKNLSCIEEKDGVKGYSGSDK